LSAIGEDAAPLAWLEFQAAMLAWIKSSVSCAPEVARLLCCFSNGIDRVFIGCWPANVTILLKEHLCIKHGASHQKVGSTRGEPQRLKLEWVSSAEGIRFAEVMNDISKKFQDLGPLGEGEGIDKNVLKFRLEAVENLLPYIKLVERERLGVRFETEEKVKEFFESDECDRLFRELIADKLAMSQMTLLLRENPLSVGEISDRLCLDPSEVRRHLHRSVKQGFVRFDEGQKRFALA
jgi:coenzyme F420-reducing hydrogenase delta subunit